ncbi:MAG TPA: helix-turn-helix domain-containing protein [Chitinophagaceae bacterium]|nr:helix-turn-helix domain-containing protein [Chitinophagaceae bacterium]
MKKINSETAYNKVLAEVNKLMHKGEENLTDDEANNILSMAKAIQNYEKVNYPFPMPKTIKEIVELKMFEKKLNKVSLAKILGIGAPKLSQILNNKREPDVPFLKALHEKLGVDGNFILERV